LGIAWIRTIGSTLVGQGLDSLMLITLAFVGTIPPAGLSSAIVTQWLAKSAYEAAGTPLMRGASSERWCLLV
jgi:uncharacterized PurR-regulated membrane protein YhhQ (DUF165 family)